MKITIFGLTLSSSWGNGHATPYRAILRALHGLGHSTTFFEKDAPYYARHRDFISCDYCHLVLYTDWSSIRAKALATATESDVVITASYLPEGARINDDVLALSRPLRVFYDLDTPITLANLQTGALDYLEREQVPGFDLYLSFTGGRILYELQTVWNARSVAPIYGCADPEVHFPMKMPASSRCALSYMGTHSTGRRRALEELFFRPARKLPSQMFVLAGSLYPEGDERACHALANVRRLEHVCPSDHPVFYSGSRATLNLTRAEMAGYGHCPSGRLFEAAACGAPLLSDGWQGLGEFFQSEREIIVVKSGDDVLRALALSDAELNRMAERARERALDEHTGIHRARAMVNAFETARSRSRSVDVSNMAMEVMR